MKAEREGGTGTFSPCQGLASVTSPMTVCSLSCRARRNLLSLNLLYYRNRRSRTHFSSLSCLSFCGHMCVTACAYAGTCPSVCPAHEGQRLISGIFLEAGSLLWTQSSLSQLVASQLAMRTPCLCLQVFRITDWPPNSPSMSVGAGDVVDSLFIESYL